MNSRSDPPVVRVHLTAATLDAADKAAAPVVLPTVKEVREAIIAAERDGGWIEHTVACAVLDLIASRVPAWVPVNVDDIRPGMRVRWVRGNSDTEGSFTVRDIADDRFYFEDGHVSRRMSYTWYIDPHTVPADPEDPRVELLAEELEAASGCCFDSWPCSEADRWYRDARLILARLDAVRADA